MPGEQEWIDRIWGVVGPREHATLRELTLVEQALAEHPHSAPLWCLRGDLIQLSEDGEGDYVLEDALASYERATVEEPEDYEGWESMGYYHDLVEGDLEAALDCFRRAVELDGERDSWTGLAWALARRGSVAAALRFLEPGTCPFAHEPEVRELRAEIEALEPAG